MSVSCHSDPPLQPNNVAYLFVNNVKSSVFSIGIHLLYILMPDISSFKENYIKSVGFTMKLNSIF